MPASIVVIPTTSAHVMTSNLSLVSIWNPWLPSLLPVIPSFKSLTLQLQHLNPLDIPAPNTTPLPLAYMPCIIQSTVPSRSSSQLSKQLNSYSHCRSFQSYNTYFHYSQGTPYLPGGSLVSSFIWLLFEVTCWNAELLMLT